MAEFSPDIFLATVGLIGAVIVVSALCSGLIEKSGLPQVAVFLGMGALIGPAGANLITADLHSPMLRVVGTLSLVLVLFTDAVSLNLTEVRRNRVLSALVLGPGTLLLAVFIALLGWWLLGLPPVLAAILGAALASTDPVLLRGLVRRPAVDPTVKQALRLEGGMNDAILLPIVLVGIALVSQGRPLTGSEWSHLLLNILFLSPAAGVVTGLAAIGTLELVRKKVGVRRDYESIYSLGVAFAAFAAAESVHGSGFLAAFAAGLTISAIDVELCDCFLEYGETTAEMALMFAFVLFGTSLIWSGLGIVGPGTLLFTAGVFIARPAAFLPALAPVSLRWKNRGLIAWFGPKGLSSLLLILLPVFAGLPGSEGLLTIACLVVLCSVVLHGLSPMFLVREPAPAPPAAAEPRDDATLEGYFCPLKNEVADLPASEFISIGEVRDLQRHNAPLVIVDARSERTWSESTEDIPGAVRLHPDNPVIQAEKNRVPREAVLAVLCA